jgi:hypothetical protein
LMARRAAREVLPLVVVVWATLVVLGGAYKGVEGGAVVNQDTAAAGLGLCAVSVAALLRVGARRPVPVQRPETTIVAAPGMFRAARPVAYARPLPTAPSLELLQILRT